ncbi:MAG: LysM peptidoglycan-binding domain-containing protein [Acidimicrobiia bacterium]|nr:LysM peptidoglycan-binding domain-containing protein [Acidimicrobiia bacterium]
MPRAGSGTSLAGLEVSEVSEHDVGKLSGVVTYRARLGLVGVLIGLLVVASVASSAQATGEESGENGSSSMGGTVVVKPGDTLRKIAMEHLGDENRWPEIYEINKGVVQADGRALTDPDLIRIGWVLQIGQVVSDRSELIARLRENAERFEYAIGTPGGTLTIATISKPLTFNLALANDTGSTGLLGYLFEGLTDTSWLTNQVEPGLAESWERSDDGLKWTFHLRRGAHWHDGEPFTAQDVDFTFNRIIYNDDLPVSARSVFTFRHLDAASGAWRESRMTVRALDTHTIEFVLPAPFAPFLRSLGTPIYPRHILEKHVDDGSFSTTWDIDTDPAEVIGTGPFLIEEYRPGERVVLKRNPHYWMKDEAGNNLPYLDQVVRLIVPDLEAELAGFLSTASDVHGVSGEEFAQLEPLQESQNFTIHRRGPGFGTTFLVFNMNPGTDTDTGNPYVAPEMLEWFRNKRFRQAVAHSINKDAIIDGIQHGLAYEQWSSISPAAGDFHNPDVRKYEYDIAKANQILDSIGWTDTNGDGIREDTNGNDLEFSLVTNSGNSVRERVTTLIQKGMKAIGLRVNHQTVAFGDLVKQLTESYDWEAVVIGLSGGSDPYGGIDTWHSSGGLHMWHPNQPQPETAWEATIDGLYVEGSQELDRQKRVEFYHRAQEIVAENVPLIYTTLAERLTATRNVFGNTTPTLYGLWDIRYLYRTD